MTPAIFNLHYAKPHKILNFARVAVPPIKQEHDLQLQVLQQQLNDGSQERLQPSECHILMPTFDVHVLIIDLYLHQYLSQMRSHHPRQIETGQQHLRILRLSRRIMMSCIALPLDSGVAQLGQH
jgi:hypothetical protein